jgi:hypothetical protein
MLFAAPSAYVALLTLQAGGQIQIAACDPFVDAIATPVLIIEVRITQCAWANSFFALAREVQEQLEDVDEVQVERERPERGELLVRFSVEILAVLLLNRLGIPCGQPDEDEDADDGDYKLKRARCEEDVH